MELKKCPFCGGKAEEYTWWDETPLENDGKWFATIKCDLCDATGKWINCGPGDEPEPGCYYFEKAAAAWNQRVIRPDMEDIRKAIVYTTKKLEELEKDFREYSEETASDFEKRIAALEDYHADGNPGD